MIFWQSSLKTKKKRQQNVSLYAMLKKFRFTDGRGFPLEFIFI
jgi:hypothetical protein